MEGVENNLQKFYMIFVVHYFSATYEKWVRWKVEIPPQS
jgi:hypothetical protein